MIQGGYAIEAKFERQSSSYCSLSGPYSPDQTQAPFCLFHNEHGDGQRLPYVCQSANRLVLIVSPPYLGTEIAPNSFVDADIILISSPTMSRVCLSTSTTAAQLPWLHCVPLYFQQPCHGVLARTLGSKGVISNARLETYVLLLLYRTREKQYGFGHLTS